MVFQPQIILHLGLIGLLAAVFYLFIPGIGAFHIRGTWRKFRVLLIQSARTPSLTYKAVRSLEKTYEREDERGFRFFCRLQALQGNSIAWVTDEHVTVMADLENVYIYLLSFHTPLSDKIWEKYPAEPPRRVLWEKISSLPEYTKIFISGRLHRENGRLIFKDSPEHPLLVIIYEGDERDLLIRGVWSGRQKNEYWNSLTPGALSLGAFSLFVYFYILLRFPSLLFPAILALTLAVFPLTPFLPPGVLGFYYYRQFWKQGRVLRAQRDLIRMPMVFFRDTADSSNQRSALLPNGENYEMRALPNEYLSSLNQFHKIVPRLPLSKSKQWHVFCSGQADRIRPLDPMAEALLVPGEPYSVARNCEKQAVKYEVSGLLIMAAGVGVTEILMFVIFSYLIL